MISREIWRSVIIYSTVAGLLSLAVIYAAFHLMFSTSLPTTGFAGALQFFRFVLYTFVVPLALFALCGFVTHRLVRRRRIADIFMLAIVIITGTFLGGLTETFLREFLSGLVPESPKMLKLLASGMGGSIRMGTLLGALTGAKANWTQQPP